MLSKRTLYGIEALLAIDDEAAPTDRQAVLSAARGSWGECSIAEVARRLGCGRPRVYRLIREGHLTPTRAGCTISEAELSRYLDGVAGKAVAS